MASILNKKIKELKHCIELSNSTLQDCDNEIEKIKQHKNQIKAYITKCLSDIKTLEMATSVIEEMKTQEKPFVEKEKYHKGTKRNFVLKNLSAKTETIKILKEKPNKLWLTKEIGQELLLRDGQDPEIYSDKTRNTVLKSIKSLCEEGFAEKIEQNDEVYWRKAK